MNPIRARFRALLLTVAVATLLVMFAGGALATEEPAATNGALAMETGAGGGSGATGGTGANDADPTLLAATESCGTGIRNADAGETGLGDSSASGTVVAQTGEVGLEPSSLSSASIAETAEIGLRPSIAPRSQASSESNELLAQAADYCFTVPFKIEGRQNGPDLTGSTSNYQGEWLVQSGSFGVPRVWLLELVKPAGNARNCSNVKVTSKDKRAQLSPLTDKELRQNPHIRTANLIAVIRNSPVNDFTVTFTCRLT